MTPVVVVCLSGRVGAGKTSVARALARRTRGVQIVSTRELLMERLAVEDQLARHGPVRQRLQEIGEELDRTTSGNWVLDALRRVGGTSDVIVIDAVRTIEQVTVLREGVGRVIHVHLSAPPDVLASRYGAKQLADPQSEVDTYGALSRSATEARVDWLAHSADLQCSTHTGPPEKVAAKIASAIASVPS